MSITESSTHRYRPHLLIVDDVLANVALLGEALTDDYEVQFANSGAEALQLAQQAPPDLILLDIMMPEMDGYQTFRHLQATAALRCVPVIFVTALSETSAEAAGLALGAVDYIIKPFDVGITRLRIKNLLERSRLQRELELALSCSRQGMWEWGPDSELVSFSAQCAQPLGYAPGVIQPEVLTWEEIVHPDDLPGWQAEIAAHCTGTRAEIASELRLRDHAGDYCWVQMLGRGIGGSAGQRPTRVLGTYMDISVRKQAQLALQQSEAYLALLIASSPDMVLSCNAGGRLVSLHIPADLRDLATNDDWRGRSCGEALLAPLAQAIDSAAAALQPQHGTQAGECRLEQADGTRYLHVTVNPLTDGSGGFLAVVRDISKERRAEEEIRRLAYHDALTGLANRRLLLDRLRLAQQNSARQNTFGAVLFIDLDNFKALNDTWGHQVGDLLLVKLAQRLKASVRENDVVSRLGGDEFVVLLERLGGDEISAQMHVQTVADGIRMALNNDYQLGEISYHCSGSIGVRLFFGKQEDADQLIDDADQAMYQVKQSKRSNFGLFVDNSYLPRARGVA